MGLYTLPGWAQESGDGTIPSVNESANAQTASEKAPVVTESKPIGHLPTIRTPAISKATGSMSATDKIVARFMKLDSDMSAGVSFEEYMRMVKQRATARYAMMDSNHDGEVTDVEYRRFWKLRMAQWYRLKR